MKYLVAVALVALVGGGCDSQSETPLDAPHAPDASVGKAVLIIDRASFDFGNVAVGTRSAPATFTLFNNGKTASGPLHVGVGAFFDVDAGTCTGSLAVAASCSFSVTFAPVEMTSKTEMVTIIEGTNVGTSASANVRGMGVSPNQLALTMPNHDFGSLVVGAPNPTFEFEVRNYAPTTTGAITADIKGADASAFSSTTTCTTLAPNASCKVTVTALTSTSGTKSAWLEVRALPGGVTMANLYSKLLTPAALSMATASDAQFGDIVIGNSLERTFVVSNSGTQPSGPISVALAPGNFTVLTGGLSDCVSGVTSLTLGTTCNVRVRFQPTTGGSKTAALSVSATPGGAATLTLTGNALTAGQLVGDASEHEFEATEVSVLSASSFTWNITNTGQAFTSTPGLLGTGTGPFSVVSNGCTSPLAPGATCAIVVRFRPTTGGLNNGTLTLTASLGGSTSLVVKGQGLWRLTVTTVGTGTVTAPGINCGAGATTCSALFAQNTAVTLSARPANGSGFQFSSWGQYCSGRVNDCTLSMTGARTASASFTAITNNIAFVSSATYPANLGGVAAYDQACNTLATDAGINNVDGTAFKAWLSDDTSNAVTRLGADTGGWRMLDGRIFARSMTDLVNSRVLNPLGITEKGAVAWVYAWTGSHPDGTVAADHCTNWSSNVGKGQVGIAGDGPASWTQATTSACNLSQRLLCLQTTSTTAIAAALPPPAAKIIYYTDGFVPGGGIASANAYCNAHKPSLYSTRTFRALLATSTQAVSSIVNAATNYYRPDGTLVGQGSALSASALASGIWQRDDGTYPSELVRAWTGSSAANAYGTVTSSCNDWTYNDPGATGMEGILNRIENLGWWVTNPAIPCNSTRALYCVEQ